MSRDKQRKLSLQKAIINKDVNNRYYIVKIKSSNHKDDFVYGFSDSYDNVMFSVDGEFLLIENPADAITVCTFLNKRHA